MPGARHRAGRTADSRPSRQHGPRARQEGGNVWERRSGSTGSASVRQATKKITRAMELMAASRVVKAQQRVRSPARTPGRSPRHSRRGDVQQRGAPADHREVRRQARGGAHHRPPTAAWPVATTPRAIKESERLVASLQEEGKEVVPYLAGRKAVNFYKFRHREFAAEWSGFSERRSFETPARRSRAARRRLHRPTEEGGIDEVHVVYTRFVSMVTQEPEVLRLLPLEVVEGEEAGTRSDLLPLYSFEPSAEKVLDALLPKYVTPASTTAAAVGRVRAGRAPAGDEVGDGQRRRAHQDLHPAGQPGPPGRDHPRDQRDRRRRQRPRPRASE
jgi:F-type H+-transporting ATPase subunit gamma